MELSKMYGKNGLSPKKVLVIQGLKLGKNLKDLSEELQIAQPTAEVYAIDCLAAGRDVDHQKVAEYMQISGESFQIIKNEILQSDKKLRTVRDNLNEAFNYNQIRFVLACMIQDLHL